MLAGITAAGAVRKGHVANAEEQVTMVDDQVADDVDHLSAMPFINMPALLTTTSSLPCARVIPSTAATELFSDGTSISTRWTRPSSSARSDRAAVSLRPSTPRMPA